MVLLLLVATALGSTKHARAEPVPENTPRGIFLVTGNRNSDSLPISVDIDLAPLINVFRLSHGIHPTDIRAALSQEDKSGVRPLPSQFDPAPDFHPRSNPRGRLSFLLPPGDQPRRVAVYFTPLPSWPVVASGASANLATRRDGASVTVSNEHFTVRHDSAAQAGLPSKIVFNQTGKIFDTFRWDEMVYHPKLGVYGLQDPEPRLRIAEGPLMTTVSVSFRYMRGDDWPTSRPRATYDFTYYPSSPLVRVRVRARQDEPFGWSEMKLMQIAFADDSFTEWSFGDPLNRGAFARADYIHGPEYRPRWGALRDGANVLGLIDPEGSSLGIGDYGSGLRFLMGAWRQWNETDRRFNGFLWIGTEEAAPGADAGLGEAAHAVPSISPLSVEAVGHALRRLQILAGQASDPAERGRILWAASVLAFLEREEGMFEATLAWSEKIRHALEDGKSILKLPWFDPSNSAMTLVDDGRMGLGFIRREGTYRLISLFDLQSGEEMLGSARPMWTLLCDAPGGFTRFVDSEQAGVVASLRVSGQPGEPRRLRIEWVSAGTADLPPGFRAVADAVLREGRAAFEFSVSNPSLEWRLREVEFPRLAFGAIGNCPEDDIAALPQNIGILNANPLGKAFIFPFTETMYPGGCTMQFGAYYDRNTALYFAAEDPLASLKQFTFAPRPAQGRVEYSIRWPVPGVGKGGNDFTLSGKAVLQFFDGDWFDAARIYRQWVSAHSRWWPWLKEAPQSLRDVMVWVGDHRPVQERVPSVRQFAEELGLPVGNQSYDWHDNPFDNDLPHHLPPRNGFLAGWRAKQERGVRIMPYTNLRLWDTRDQGTNDFAFTRHGRPAAVKREGGGLVYEGYGSTESDGSPVVFAAMCPAAPGWREKVRETVFGLVDEYGVDGIYFDTLYAQPYLCYDPSHGHPLGGGHWYTVDGVGKVLSEIRRELKARNREIFFAGEFLGEGFGVEGQLIGGHFKGTVPMFHAVYGGVKSLFRVFYMDWYPKFALQLIWGEQLGWVGPNIVEDDRTAFAYLKKFAHMRHALRSYLVDGNMARPPVLRGDIPTETHYVAVGEVDIPVLNAAAWRNEEGGLLLIFSNFAQAPVQAEVVFDAASYPVPPDTQMTLTVHADDGTEAPPVPLPRASFLRTIRVPPRSAVAWELRTEPENHAAIPLPAAPPSRSFRP